MKIVGVILGALLVVGSMVSRASANQRMLFCGETVLEGRDHIVWNALGTIEEAMIDEGEWNSGVRFRQCTIGSTGDVLVAIRKNGVKSVYVFRK